MRTKETIWTTNDERCIRTTWHFNLCCDYMLGNRESGIWFDGMAYYCGKAPFDWDATQEVAIDTVRVTESIVSI